jgi:hypothetical protein
MVCGQSRSAKYSRIVPGEASDRVNCHGLRHGAALQGVTGPDRSGKNGTGLTREVLGHPMNRIFAGYFRLHSPGQD